MDDLIYSHNWKKIADFIVSDEHGKFVQLSPDMLERDAIILCRTDKVNELFDYIKFSDKKYVLITSFTDRHVSESDERSTHYRSALFDKKPDCIKKWYAYTTTFHHPDLIQIPIGFNSFVGDGNIQWFINNYERLSHVEKDEQTLYCNYAVDDQRNYRKDVLSSLRTGGSKIYNRINAKLSFQNYCEEMSKFKFIVSPQGDGIDSHKNWEAIYCGCIPIVLNYIQQVDSMYCDTMEYGGDTKVGWFTKEKNIRGINIYEKYNLPILVVNDYSEVTPKLLSDYLEYYNTHEYKYEQLTLSYWKNRMIEDLKNNN